MSRGTLLDLLQHGTRMPGGCRDCDAVTLVDRLCVPGTVVLNIQHDDTCPYFNGVVR